MEGLSAKVISWTKADTPEAFVTGEAVAEFNMERDGSG
jgi:hypothetical protein